MDTNTPDSTQQPAAQPQPISQVPQQQAVSNIPPLEVSVPAAPVQLQAKKKFGLPEFTPKQKKLGLLIGGGIFVLLIVLLVVVTLMKGSPIPLPISVASPTPISTTKPDQILNPSVYADDEDTLLIKSDLEKLESDLQNVNFREDTLRIPTLDWNINF